MATMNLAAAKSLCTAQEFALVKASFGRKISADPAKLVATLERARKQRDKWRDLALRQRRETQRQQAARPTDKNARSEEKSQLFAETVQRLELQLEQIGGVGSLKAKVKRAGPRGMTKQQRTLEHREARASIRGKLQQKKLSIMDAKRKTSQAAPPSSTKSAGKKNIAKTASGPRVQRASNDAAVGEANASMADQTGKTKPPKRSIPPTKKVTRPKLVGVVPLIPAKQIRAKAAAKQARKQAAGLTSRMPGHVGARTRRVQAKRDQR